MHYITSIISSFVERVWSIFLALIIPRYLKKVIFIASVYIVLFELSSEDKAAFKKINDKMKLVNKEDLLMIPRTIVDSIWESADIKKLLEDAVLVKQHKLEPCSIENCVMSSVISDDYKPAMYLATKIVEKTPSWLRYGKTEEQVNDILMPAHDSLYATI